VVVRVGRLVFVSCVSIAILAACARDVFQSEYDAFESGLSYYLPKTLLTINIEAIGYPEGTPVAELTAEQSTAAGQTGAVLVEAQIDGINQSVLVNNKGQLADEFVTSLRLGAVEPVQVADVNYNYVLQYQADVLFSDRICMGVDEKSLLKFVEAATKDETGNVVISIAKFVGRIAGPGAFTTAGAPQKLESTITTQIDPYNVDDIAAVDRAINARFPKFHGRFRFNVEGAGKFDQPHHLTACPKNKICYRTRKMVRIGLGDYQTQNASMQYAEVVNRAEVHTIDVTRAFMVEKLTRLGFSNGTLEKVVIEKPSEALETAKLPLTVYDAVMTSALAAPGRFLGQITPGMDATEVLTILESQRLTVVAANNLRKELNQLRNDLDNTNSLDQPAAAQTSGAFSLGCSFTKNGNGGAVGMVTPLGQ